MNLRNSDETDHDFLSSDIKKKIVSKWHKRGEKHVYFDY